MKAAAFLAFILCAGSVRAATPVPTASEIAACLPDAFRLCSDHFPDRAAVFRCMRTNKSRLSAGCRAVFLKHRL